MDINELIKKEQEEKLKIMGQIAEQGMTDELRQSKKFKKLFPNWGKMWQNATEPKENVRY